MDERERFRRVEEVFRAACGLEGEERERLIEAECADDAMRREVMELLEEDSSPLIGEPTSVGLASDLLRPDVPATVPEVEGFRIVRLIGAGGMGVVYEAEQVRPNRRVALKLLRTGAGSVDRLRRFQLEAEFLGRLRHTGIAQVFAVGTTTDGRPYFAMELVDGQPVTEFAEAERLGISERVELFLRVCDGVVHAHQQGVIHRDLKPGNILVESDGTVKVLDFGIARAAENDGVTTLATLEGQLVGTLAYMSPEQAAGDPDAIDTRTDVYSLGVVLFEILAGRRPHELDRLALDEALRVVRMGEATRLGSLDRRLRGDLETIAFKALEKEKDRRYQSVSELGEDLRRFLRDEPVVARPPSTLYQVRKFAARHRPLVAGAAAVLLALVVGLVGVLIALDRAIEAERLAEQRLVETQAALERADQQALIASAAKEFMTDDLLAAASPDAMGADTPVREVLRAASERIGDRTDLDPLFRSEILISLGKTLSVAGEYEMAESHLADALEIRREIYGEDHLLTIEALKEVGTVYVQMNMYEADRLARTETVLRVRRRDLGPEHDQTIVAMNDHALALADANRLDEAMAVYEEALATADRALGPDSERAGTILNNMGWALEHTDPERAEHCFKESLRIRRKVHGPRHSRTLLSANTLGSFYWSAGRLDEAEPLYIETLAARMEVLGERHPHTLNSMDNLGTLYLKRGDHDGAMEYTGRALEIIREEYGARHFRAARTMNNVAAIHRGKGEHAEAEAIFAEAFEIMNALEGRQMLAGWLRRNQGAMLWKMGRVEEAEETITHALELLSGEAPETHPWVQSTLTLLAEFYEDQGRLEEASAARARLVVKAGD